MMPDRDSGPAENPEMFMPTLYNLTSNIEFLARKTEPKDIPEILKLVTHETRLVFDSCDAGKHYEKSVFSIVLTDLVNIKKIVAHASYSDYPQDADVNIDGKLWKSNSDLRGMNALNTLFLRFFVSSLDIASELTLQETIGNTFLACTLIDYIVLETPSLKYSGMFDFSPLCRDAELTTKHKIKKKVLIYDKNIMYPKMKIREGREHDLDDLSPLMTIETSEMEENFNKSYLNDLIAMSDRNNQSVVAEHKSIAVGMLTVTTDINYALLNAFFQLEPFHGLYKPHLRDDINLAYRRKEEESDVCRADDDRKYITDDYQESVGGSDKNSRTGMSASDSASTFSNSIDSMAKGVTDVRSKKSGLHQNVGVSTQDARISDIFAGSTRSDLIVPTTSSTDDVFREGKDGTYTKSALEEEIRKFPKEVIQLHEQLRQGHLAVEDVAGLDEDLKSMLSRLEELLSKREREVRVQRSNFNLREEICHPFEIITEHRPIYHGIPNALAIQLCVMNKKFNIRILDLIQGAFLCFPNREYCIVTIPFGIPVPNWLEYFVKVLPRRQSLYDRELYVVHRSVFNCRLRVRRGGDRDIQKVKKLVDTLYAKDKILTDFYRANQSNVCGNQNGLYSFVAVAGPTNQSHIVALVILSEQQSDHLQVNYDIDSYIYADLHELSDYAYVHHFILNPSFRRQGKKILKEVMRQMKKDVLFHYMYSPSRETLKMNHQTLLNNVDDWYLMAPRPRINYEKLGLTDVYDEDRIPPPEALDSSEPYALLLHSKKFTFDLKAEVTSRVVFVGASDTALAALQKMITTPHLNFLHLTLISPHGLPGSLKPDEIRNLMFPRRGGPPLSMEDGDSEWLDRAGIHIKVNIVYGKVTSILREQKLVVVNRKDIVPYDVLVLTVGQQFVRPDCGEVEVVDYHLNEFIEQSVNQDEKKKQKIRVPLRRLTKKPKNVFAINSEMDAAVALNYVRTQLPLYKRQRILIHGACLEAYCCLNAMLKMGVAPERIVFIIRPMDESGSFHMDWEERRPYKDTIKLRDTMTETFKMFNIKVLPNHDFLDWFLDLRTNTVTRVNFCTPNEAEIVSFSCFAYFGYNHRRIKDEFLSALLDAYINFDNGISIGVDFKTNDDKIWSAGSCSSYDNKLMAGKYDHTFYDSYEVGTLLGEKLIHELDPTKRKYVVHKVGPKSPSLPPILTKRLVHYAELPGGWCYMYCSRPGMMPKCCGSSCPCEQCQCGTEVVTGSTDPKVDRNQRYFRVWLNPHYRVEGLECLSKKRFSPWNLSHIYGVHESLLHNLVERFEKEEIPCLYVFFQQPWIAAICHDRWTSFKTDLVSLYENYMIDEDMKMYDFIRAYVDNLENPDALKVDANIIRRIFDSSGLKRKLEMKFLDFLRFNRTVIPCYARPDFVLKLIEDRRLSPLMLPNINKY